MPVYAYRAVHSSGRISCGERLASSENELIHDLSKSELEIIDAREKRPKALHLTLFINLISPRILSAFCARMHDLLAAGISFPEALQDVRSTVENRTLSDALSQISQTIASGKGIAASFALFPNLFPSVFVAIVQAGERSGNLSATFGFLDSYAEKRAQTNERLRRAIRYPLFLLVVAGGAVAFMMTMVVPQVIQFLNGINVELPFSTRLLLALSSALIDHGGAILALLIAAAAGVFGARKMVPTFAVAFDATLLRLPVFGIVISKTEVARFSQSFAILFRSGCSVAECIDHAIGTLGNLAIRERAQTAKQRILEGKALSQALDSILPPFALGVLRTGERGGNLSKSFEDIVTAYDREAGAAVDSFIGTLEPSLTLAIGALLAWTVLSVLGPLYGSLSVLGARV